MMIRFHRADLPDLIEAWFRARGVEFHMFGPVIHSTEENASGWSIRASLVLSLREEDEVRFERAIQQEFESPWYNDQLGPGAEHEGDFLEIMERLGSPAWVRK
jgi:hypothetical protein